MTAQPWAKVQQFLGSVPRGDWVNAVWVLLLLGSLVSEHFQSSVTMVAFRNRKEKEEEENHRPRKTAVITERSIPQELFFLAGPDGSTQLCDCA